MDIYEYDVLDSLVTEKYTNQRIIADITGYSLGRVNKAVQNLIRQGYLTEEYQPTDKAYMKIQKGKPKNAIILTAGYGIHMASVSSKTPMGLLKVRGQTLIERLIKQLHSVGIYEIDIVVGSLKDRYEFLIDKYNVNLVYNSEYAIKDNLHSLKLLVDKISNTYILPCDIWALDNPFSTYELYSWYAILDSINMDSLVKVNKDRRLVRKKPKEAGNTMLGICYLLEDEARLVRKNLKELSKNHFYNKTSWEIVLFGKSKPKLYAKKYSSEEIFEIGTYGQLKDLKENSRKLDYDILKLIADKLNVRLDDIGNINILKKGMTNRSFKFSVGNDQYIMRIPGEGTDKLINRKNEYHVYQTVKDKNISDDVIYMSPDTGYKITRYFKNARTCDPFNEEDVRQCMAKLREFHNFKLEVPHEFDVFEKINFYESLWGDNVSVFKDYLDTKEKILQLKKIIEDLPKEKVLSHIDSVPDNFLFIGDEIRLIDWEYAGMQDPHIDIAMFAIYSMYNKSQVDKLIDYYFHEGCPRKIRIKIYCYIAICGLLWSNWCEFKRLCGVEFGKYSLRQYRYAKEYYSIVMHELNKKRYA